MELEVYALPSNSTAFVPNIFEILQSSQYFMKIYNLFEYLLSDVYFKTSNVLRFIVLLTHICAGIREFLQMCQNNGKDSIQFCVHCSILLTFLKILL